MNKPATFTCDNCGETYPLRRPDEAARAEYASLFPEEKFPEEKVEDAAMVCTSCFKTIMRWAGHPYWTEKLGYNFTHVIYNGRHQIVGWMVDGKHLVAEPCFPMPGPDLWPLPIGHKVKL